MLMRGIKPPRLGTVKDRVMTEMFLMERELEKESYRTISLVLAVLLGADKPRLKNVFKVLADQADKLTFYHWSIDKHKDEEKHLKTDEDLLKRLNSLSPALSEVK